MASNSDPKSGSSGSSANRKVIRVDTSPRNRRLYEPVVSEHVRQASSESTRARAGDASERARCERRGVQSGASPSTASAPRRTDLAAQAKRDERERRRSERVRRARLRLALVVIALITLVAGGVAIHRSQLFDVRTIEVLGASHSTPDAVILTAAVPDDATLLRFPAAAIKERILADPWIADATITRDFPHTLRIRLTERAAQAAVDTGAGLFVVDAAGVVLGEHSLEETMTLAVIRDVPGLDLKVGRTSTSEVLGNALAVLGGIGTELGSRVRALTAPSIDETMLITTDNVEILIGEAIQMEKKRLIVEQILREQAGTVVFIDVRSTERPVSRGLPQ